MTGISRLVAEVSGFFLGWSVTCVSRPPDLAVGGFVCRHSLAEPSQRVKDQPERYADAGNDRRGQTQRRRRIVCVLVPRVQKGQTDEESGRRESDPRTQGGNLVLYH